MPDNSEKRISKFEPDKKWFQAVLRSIGDAVIAADENGLVQYLNPVAEQLTGWENNEATGKPLSEIFHIINEETREKVENPVEKVLHKGAIVGIANSTLLISRDGREIPIADSGAPITNDDGKIAGVVLVFRDQTREREAQKAMLEANRVKSEILESVTDGFVALDRNWRYTYVNKKAAVLLNREKPEDLLGKHIWTEYPDGVGQPFYKNYYKAMETGEMIVMEDYYEPWDRWFENRIYPSKDGISIYFTEITERKRAEERLRKNEERIRALLAAIPDLIFTFDRQGVFLDFHAPENSKLFAEPDFFLNKSLADIFPEEIVELSMQHLEKVFQTGECQIFQYDLEMGGEIRRYEARIVLKNQDEALAIIRDLTEMKMAQQAAKEAQENFRDVVENSPDGVIIADEAGKMIFANKRVTEITGYPGEELLNMTGWQMTKPEEVQKYQEIMKKRLKGEPHPKIYERTLIRKDGSEVITEFRTTKTLWKGKIRPMVVIRDLTEQKNAEAQMRRDLKEKTLLLSEIHHRVKNNLQIIASLLHLQSRKIQNKEVLEHFNDARSRILAMAGIYEKLYHSKSFAEINIKDYIDSTLVEKFQLSPISRRVKLILEVKGVNLSIDNAIPLSLILNELLTNSIKHAFPEDKTGSIKIKLDKFADDSYELVYQDNGIGLPKDFNFDSTESFGLHLVKLLADQIEGKASFQQNAWTTFRVKFWGYGNAKKNSHR